MKSPSIRASGRGGSPRGRRLLLAAGAALCLSSAMAIEASRAGSFPDLPRSATGTAAQHSGTAAGGMLPLLLAFGGRCRRALCHPLHRLTRALRAPDDEARKLSLVASRAHNGVVLTDAAGTIEWVNESVAHVTGLREDELQGRSLRELLYSCEATPETHDIIASSLDQQTEFTAEVRILDRAAERRRWLVLNGQPLYDRGRVSGWIVIGSDVTELREAQDAIHRRTQQTVRYTSALLELARFDLSQLDRALAHITETTARTLGVSRVSVWFLTSEPPAIECHDLYRVDTGTHERGLILYERDHPAYFAALRTHAPVNAADAQHDPRTCEFTDGYLRPSNITSMLDVPVWQGGVPIGVLCLEQVGPQRTWAEDDCAFATSVADTVSLAVQTSERARAELALRAERDRSHQIVMGSPSVICEMAADGTILFVNPAAERVSGYRADEIVGRNGWRLFYPGADYAQVEQLFRQLEHGDVREYEMVCTTSSGERRMLAWNTLLRRDHTGRITRMIGFGHDVTIRKRMEEQHRIAKDSAEAASRLKSEFLATMSHEIRTPLNGVIGMMGVLLDTPLTSDQREYAELARQSGESLLDIVNDILDFSKIEAGRLQLEIVDFDLRAVVEETVSLFAEPAYRKGLELTCSMPAAIPGMVRSDPGRLRQILTNLIGNAVKFTAEGDILVQVRIAGDDGQPLLLRFDVTDTGIGLTPEQQSRIFEPFTQADGSTTRRYGGTGLGLSVSKRLVELMGGTIGVTSAARAGSTFWFTACMTRGDHAPTPPATADALPPLRILVADAHAPTRTLVADMLTAWRMMAVIADDTDDILSRLQQAAAAEQPYHAVVLSQRIADADDSALPRAICRDMRLAGTRVIVMRPLGHRREMAAASAGMEWVLPKPVRQSQLYSAIMGMANTPAHPPPAATSTETLPHVAMRARILVAEDNVVNQKVAARMLEKRGYRVDVVADGREAVAALGGIRYALVLMDCQMPEMDGFEATRVIRTRDAAAGARVPIVAMTANALKGDRERCLAAGMDDYLAKPVSNQELDRVLGQWLGAPDTASAR